MKDVSGAATVRTRLLRVLDKLSLPDRVRSLRFGRGHGLHGEPVMVAESSARARAGDAALASMVLVLGLMEVMSAFSPIMPGIKGILDGPAAVAVGLATVGAQATLVYVRRRWPRRSFALLALVGVAQFATIGAYPTYSWAVLAFTVARTSGRRACALAGPVLAASVAGAAFVSTRIDGWEEPVVTGAATGLTITVFVLIGVIAGCFTQWMAHRAEQELAAGDRARRAAAIATEHTRIAEEIGSGVLDGLSRLVGQCERVAGGATDAELRRLSEQARAVLAAMRRVLGMLRAAPEPQDTASGHEVMPERRGLSFPDRPGMLALGAVVIPAVVLAAIPIGITGMPGIDPLLGLLDLPTSAPFGLVVVSIQFAAVAWWRTAPLSAVSVWGVCALLAASLDATNLAATMGWVPLAWGSVSRAPAIRSAVAVGLTAPIANILVGAPATSWTRFALPIVVVSSLAVVPLWTAGILVRRRRVRSEHERLKRSVAQDREIIAQERLRVARELHDVVAHHVSALAVQSGAARIAPDPAGRAEALAYIAGCARSVAEALPELAGLTPDSRGVTLDRQGLDRLLEPVRGAGLPVDAELEGIPAGIPGEAELFAQRILTEALTNVLRHAGPSPTSVRVEHTPNSVSVRVSDSGPVAGHRPVGDGAGLGLVGMRERAALLGGSLRAGVTDGPGWTVRADLPRHGNRRD